MRVLLQRVRSASVAVDGQVVGKIGGGLLALVGIGHSDTTDTLSRMAAKVLDLRIFEDDAGKMNLSLREIARTPANDIGLLMVSQFTLYADTRKGRRPGFSDAAPPDLARGLMATFATIVAEQGITVEQGAFGKHMIVSLENDGPVTIWLDSADLPTR